MEGCPLKKHLIPIGAAFVAGVACWQLMDHYSSPNASLVLAGFLAVVIGAVTEIVVVLFQERDDAKRGLERVETTFTRLVETLGERITKDESVRYLLQYINRDLPKEQMLETWIDLLTQLRTTYCATNYINTDSVYTNDWGQAALLIQNAKKKAYNERVVIRKVFLIDKDEEIPMVSASLEEQKNIGVQIHYLPHGLIKEDPYLNGLLRSKEIPSVDFGVFNEDIVLVWDLKDREVSHGRVLVGREHAQRHTKFFEALFQKARDFNRDRIVVVPFRDQTREIVARWPRYRAPYEEMDCILRSPGGWLDRFRTRAKSKIYAAYEDGSLLGFSIFECTEEEAEMYVAVHPNQVNNESKRFGSRLTRLLLEKGFKELALKRIRVSVPRRYPRTISLFENAGFVHGAEDGEPVKLSLDSERYLTLPLRR
jgi:L-amino acid N-acyltransferase YncA